MPNHCYGYLEVSGEPKLLNKFMKQIEVTESEATSERSATKFSLDKVIPMPKELLNGDGWYDWRVSNWGTKWDLCDLETNDEGWEEGFISYNFWTAWSPPEQVLEALTTQHPKLSFSYKFADEGGGFWGLWNFSNGMKDVVEEGDDRDLETMSQEDKCRVRREFYLHGSDHHTCKECGEWGLECRGGEVLDTDYLCEECETSLAEIDNDLWETNDHQATTSYEYKTA